MKLTAKTKNELWWLLISVDYDYERVVVADHELSNDTLTIWLEDKHDFKSTLAECLMLQVSKWQLNKYLKNEFTNMGKDVIRWYQEDASVYQQKTAREIVVNKILKELVENEISTQL